MAKRIELPDEATTKFEQWLIELNEELKAQHQKQFPSLEWKDLQYSKGRKYAKIYRANSVWGFVAMQDIPEKNFKEGDLLKAAGRGRPAKHSRGNIFEGTARYSKYGPEYLK